MADKPPKRRPRRRVETIACVNFQVSDLEPFLTFALSVAALQEEMAAGRMTIEEAADALRRLLTLFEGETL